MRYKILLFFLTCIFYFLTSTSETNAQEKWPKTLLWRISGNSLDKPSFLYGTMHLQDKRLFYFSDSLYAYLEQADGYALEVDMKEYIDYLMQKVFENVESEFVSEIKDPIESADKKRQKEFIDSLIQNVRKKADKESRRKLREWRIRQLGKTAKSAQMPTIMDIYLYDIAKRHGKWLGAVEDLEDQLDIVDEIGGDIDSKDLLDRNIRLTIDKMIEIYLDQDLQRIEGAYLNQSENIRQKVFIKRNIKMAQSMDSLSQLRSMFFSVGAGHLPGDSGVIKLLRAKGYTVEPVFSNKKIDPEKYSLTLKKTPWTRFEDSSHLYSAEMPGMPDEYNLFGEMMKLKMYVDVSNMSYYMTGYSIVRRDLSKPEDLFKEIADNIGKKSKTQNIKRLNKDGIEGLEGLIMAGNYNYHLRIWQTENTLFIMMHGSGEKNKIETENVKRFFESFSMHKRETEKPDWVEFKVEEKAFTVRFPGTPKKNKSLEKIAEGTTWSFTAYDYLDAASGMYYIMQVRDLIPGYYLDGDSAYFDIIEKDLGEAMKNIIRNERVSYQGFPAFYLSGHAKEAEVVYQTLNVNRGNRVYFLMAIAAKTGQSMEEGNQFLNSLKLLDYFSAEPTRHISPDSSFSTSVTFPFEIRKNETENIFNPKDQQVHYISFNPNEAISYEIFKEDLGPYFWINNDSTLQEFLVTGVRNSTDSILDFRKTMNGTLEAYEWKVQLKSNNNTKIARKILNADTLYSLITFVPTQYLEEQRHKKFFEDFRVVIENPTHFVFINKAEKLLKDLQSADSAIFEAASSALSSAVFTDKELPLLQEALLMRYPDSSDFYNVHDHLINAILPITNDNTLDFVKNNYSSLKGNKESLKYELLHLLARMKTRSSYVLLKDVLLNDPPGISSQYGLSYRVADSLELCKILYPEILQLISNEFLSADIVYYTKRMLDSSQIELKEILPYKKDLLLIADTIVAGFKKENQVNYYRTQNLIHLLGDINDNETNKALQKFLSMDESYIQNSTILRLLKNGQPVDAKKIENLAADKYYRVDFYNELKKMGKENLFPAKYLTQRYFAESDIYMYASDEYETDTIEYLSSKTAEFFGEQKRFYLFKIKYVYDEGEKEEFLGIAGPFSMNQKDFESNRDATGIYYDEPFNSRSVDKFFQTYLKNIPKD